MLRESKDYLEWFCKAGEDELSIQAVLKEGAPSTACFLSQQMAEKYLKGLAVFYNRFFPKVHDLLGLETILMDAVPHINEIHHDLEWLNRYYIETRYPGDYSAFTSEEAKSAFDAASRVKQFVLKEVDRLTGR